MPVQEGDHDDGSGDRTESGQSSGSSTTSVKRRGPKKKLREDERFTITTITRGGQPIEPLRTKDTIPICIELWNQPKKEELHVYFVEDTQKEDLWNG